MSALHGCHNRALRDDLQVQVGWQRQGGRRTALIPNRMSRECRYDLRATDPRCAGCKWVATTSEEPKNDHSQ